MFDMIVVWLVTELHIGLATVGFMTIIDLWYVEPEYDTWVGWVIQNVEMSLCTLVTGWGLMGVWQACREGLELLTTK